MPTLLAYIDLHLAEQLHDKLTFTYYNNDVFAWLKTADRMQLDQLKDACIYALGTYLLPDFPSKFSAHKADLSELTPPTLVDLFAATSRCNACTAPATRASLCKSDCYGRRSSKVTINLREQRDDLGATCGQCAFKPKKVWPRMVNVCPGCKQVQSWVV